jgi:hypothetical protein
MRFASGKVFLKWKEEREGSWGIKHHAVFLGGLDLLVATEAVQVRRGRRMLCCNRDKVVLCSSVRARAVGRRSRVSLYSELNVLDSLEYKT